MDRPSAGFTLKITKNTMSKESGRSFLTLIFLKFVSPSITIEPDL